MTINPVAFKGIYKVTLPNVKDAKNKAEKDAFSEVVIGTVVMGANASIDAPKADKASGSVYFKIDDKNDAKFEAGFKNILEVCNKEFNMDLAKKAYIQKVGVEEYNKAETL